MFRAWNQPATGTRESQSLSHWANPQNILHSSLSILLTSIRYLFKPIKITHSLRLANELHEAENAPMCTHAKGVIIRFSIKVDGIRYTEMHFTCMYKMKLVCKSAIGDVVSQRTDEVSCYSFIRRVHNVVQRLFDNEVEMSTSMTH